MKKILLIFLLSSCATDVDLISDGKLEIGMSQAEFRDIFIWSTISSDPFLPGCYRKYLPSKELEVIAAEKELIYYVFIKTKKPSDCSMSGDGVLHRIFRDERAYNEYLNNIQYQ